MSGWEVRLIGSGGPGETVAEGIAALLRDLVADGAALGWAHPPAVAEVRDLVAAITAGIPSGDAAMAVAVTSGPGGAERIAGFGYWRRRHRPHADLEKLAVDPIVRGRGLGRTLLSTLIAAALRHRVEVLTLDLRGADSAAVALGKKAGFHAVGEARYALDLRDLR